MLGRALRTGKAGGLWKNDKTAIISGDCVNFLPPPNRHQNGLVIIISRGFPQSFIWR